MSIILKSGNSQHLASVNADGELRTFTRLDTSGASSLPVRSAAFPGLTGQFLPGEVGTVGPLDVTTSGNCTFYVSNATAAVPFTGNPVLLFEQSRDGESWAALPAMRSDTNVIRNVRVLDDNEPYRALVFDAETEGAAFVRARLTSGCAGGGMRVDLVPGAMPFTPFMATAQPVRRSLLISNTSMAVGASGVEKLLTLNRVVGGREFDTAESFVVPAGRTYLMQNLTMSQVGPSGGQSSTAAVSTFRLRFAPAPPVTLSSPVVFAARMATIVQAGDYNHLSFPLSDGLAVEGDGSACFGMSVQTTFSSAPTVDVQMVGCEF